MVFIHYSRLVTNYYYAFLWSATRSCAWLPSSTRLTWKCRSAASTSISSSGSPTSGKQIFPTNYYVGGGRGGSHSFFPVFMTPKRGSKLSAVSNGTRVLDLDPHYYRSGTRRSNLKRWRFFCMYFIQHCLVCRPQIPPGFGGCWDPTEDCCDFGIDSQMLLPHWYILSMCGCAQIVLYFWNVR